MRNPTVKLAPVAGLRASQQVAGKALFPSPEVALAMSGLARHVDGKKLESLAGRAH